MADSDKLSLGLDDIIQKDRSNNRRGGGGNRGSRGRFGRGGGNTFRNRGGGGGGGVSMAYLNTIRSYSLLYSLE